ncbi:sporulation protein [Priestia megaterium]|nr:sporulation protein [Priestia megaterium]
MIQRRPPFPPSMPMQRQVMPNSFHQTFYPNARGINPQGMNRGSSNFLARIFGRGRMTGTPMQRMMPTNSLFSGMQGVANSATPTSLLGNLQNLTNPATLSSMMGNVQKVLKVAETVGPMVQQYGPLVKNAPSLFKLYQLLRSSDTEEESETEADVITDDESLNEQSAEPALNETNNASEESEGASLNEETDFFEEELKKPQRNRISTPKLYI